MSGARIIKLDLEPELALAGFTDAHTEFFRDGREGTDRWGRERRNLWACGTGWGEDEYVCPAYEEEACPGERNPGTRFEANRTTKCDLLCGRCGGGGRSETMAYCGWSRAAIPWRVAYGEMGDSMRLDRYDCAPSAALPELPVNLIPSVEWRDKRWLHTLHAQHGGLYPWIATSLRTGQPGTMQDRQSSQGLRERLGGFEGQLVVHGLIKDDVLDDVWDRRATVMRWLRDEGADLMVTPQFSYYGDDQLCMQLYNRNRIYRWFCEAQDLGFPHVALDWPPWNTDWQREDLLGFVQRNHVKVVAVSYQTIQGKRLGIDGFYISELRKLDRDLAPDVSVLIFGLTQLTTFMQVANCLPRRNIAFSSSAAYAKAALFKLAPDGDSAPKRFAKHDVFAYNVAFEKKMIDKAMRMRQKRVERLDALEERKRALAAA